MATRSRMTRDAVHPVAPTNAPHGNSDRSAISPLRGTVPNRFARPKAVAPQQRIACEARIVRDRLTQADIPAPRSCPVSDRRSLRHRPNIDLRADPIAMGRMRPEEISASAIVAKGSNSCPSVRYGTGSGRSTPFRRQVDGDLLRSAQESTLQAATTHSPVQGRHDARGWEARFATEVLSR